MAAAQGHPAVLTAAAGTAPPPAAQGMPKRVAGARIACLDMNLQKARLAMGVQVRTPLEEGWEGACGRSIRGGAKQGPVGKAGAPNFEGQGACRHGEGLRQPALWSSAAPACQAC